MASSLVQSWCCSVSDQFKLLQHVAALAIAMTDNVDLPGGATALEGSSRGDTPPASPGPASTAGI